jgi:signal transduction histidine kinase
VEQLHELREQLRAKSFELGRSDSAAGALHNVRNALNPVTVILSQVLSETAGASSADVGRAITELAAEGASPERRTRLAAFLNAGLAHAEQAAKTRSEALASARASLSEALSILGRQGETAHAAAEGERFDVLDVVKRGATVARFAPWGEIPIELPQQGHEVCCNKTLLSQVIGNLFTNAVEAIAAADRHPGSIVVGLSRLTEAGRSGVHITITDNGKGFEPEASARLFTSGYTTKLRSGGLGLHWCANTLTRMGGTLSLSSPGTGQGAVATIVLYDPAPAVESRPQPTSQAA